MRLRLIADLIEHPWPWAVAERLHKARGPVVRLCAVIGDVGVFDQMAAILSDLLEKVLHGIHRGWPRPAGACPVGIGPDTDHVEASVGVEEGPDVPTCLKDVAQLESAHALVTPWCIGRISEDLAGRMNIRHRGCWWRHALEHQFH